MDDEKAMSRAAETVGTAVGSGWLAVRRGARRAGQAGVEATTTAARTTDRKLTERGVAPQQLTHALAEGAELARQEFGRSSRRTRKKLARTAKHTRKELAKAAEQARRDARKRKPAKTARRTKASSRADAARTKRRARDQAAVTLVEAPGKRRRWPKVLLLAVVAAGVAYVLRGRAASPDPAPVPEPRHRQETTDPQETETSGATEATETAEPR